jgi:hypothetical protein
MWNFAIGVVCWVNSASTPVHVFSMCYEMLREVMDVLLCYSYLFVQSSGCSGSAHPHLDPSMPMFGMAAAWANKWKPSFQIFQVYIIIVISIMTADVSSCQLMYEFAAKTLVALPDLAALVASASEWKRAPTFWSKAWVQSPKPFKHSKYFSDLLWSLVIFSLLGSFTALKSDVQARKLAVLWFRRCCRTRSLTQRQSRGTLLTANDLNLNTHRCEWTWQNMRLRLGGGDFAWFQFMQTQAGRLFEERNLAKAEL